MNQFAGVCIGGPADGKRVVQKSPRYKFAETALPGFDEFAYTEGMNIEIFVYNWMETPGGGLWVPEGQSIQWAVHELISDYEGRR